MSDKAPRTRRARGSLSPDEIIDGAFAVAAETGLDRLSMPELASHLGVGVTSIYWYFRRKDDLLRGMSDRAVQTVQTALPVPDDPERWQEFLADYFVELRRIFREDDTLADLTLVRIRTYSLTATHALYQQYENIVDYLVRAGFDPLTAWRVFSTAYTFTRGIVIGERTQRLNNSPIMDGRQRLLVVPDTMPHLSTLLAEGSIHLAMVSESEFQFGMELLLDGFARLHAGARAG